MKNNFKCIESINVFNAEDAKPTFKDFLAVIPNRKIIISFEYECIYSHTSILEVFLSVPSEHFEQIPIIFEVLTAKIAQHEEHGEHFAIGNMKKLKVAISNMNDAEAKIHIEKKIASLRKALTFIPVENIQHGEVWSNADEHEELLARFERALK